MTNRDAFFALVKVGLWEGVNENYNQNENRLDGLDWGEVHELAEEQSVIGIVAAGVEKLTADSIPLTDKLMLLGKFQLIEQQNLAMNQFLGELVGKMRKVGIYTLLVKGQGLAQCYERPLWRACGDIDFYLSKKNFGKANSFLLPLASHADYSERSKHQSLTIDTWKVETHANQHCGLSIRIDHVLDEIHRDIFNRGNVRSWQNGTTMVFLPSADNDVIIVFTHFLKHFYKGGLGIRQICDWCRLMWTYRNEIDVTKLKERLREMRLVSEWKAFGAFAVERLGMPNEAMPLYDASNRWKRKAKRIEDFVMMSGNFGHNRDSSYWVKYPYLIRKACSMKRRVGDLISHARIFPLDSIRFFFAIMRNGIRSVINGD